MTASLQTRHAPTLYELWSALDRPPIQLSGPDTASDTRITQLCCDSRKAAADALFVCIRGAITDGHDFALSAYRAGCRAFLVQEPLTAPLPNDALVFRSEHTRRDLALLACLMFSHPTRQMQTVGITGTKGKTTVALMCYHALDRLGVRVGYIGTCGIRFGEIHRDTRNTTPEPLELQSTLREMQGSGVQAVFLEVSSQALWQHRVDGIAFDACALTNLYPDDHIGPTEHPSFAHYAACKQRLLTEFGSPVIVANADDEASEALLAPLADRVHLCGTAKRADLSPQNIQTVLQSGVPHTRFWCHDRRDDSRVEITLPLPGDHNVQNALMALELLRSLGYPIARTAPTLCDLFIPGRFEMLRIKDATVVIDYAHNGAALRAALTALRPLTSGRLTCLFGSVGGRTQCRRAALGEAAYELSDHAYLTADDPCDEDVVSICRDIAAAFPAQDTPCRYTIIPDRATAIRAALDALQAGDTLLIAGKGDEQLQRIGKTSIAHSDSETVRAYAQEFSLSV